MYVRPRRRTGRERQIDGRSSLPLGICGAPGAGKSTLAASLVEHVNESPRRAVVASSLPSRQRCLVRQPDGGRSRDAASHWVTDVDEPNARTIYETMPAADLVVRGDEFDLVADQRD